MHWIIKHEQLHFNDKVDYSCNFQFHVYDAMNVALVVLVLTICKRALHVQKAM